MTTSVRHLCAWRLCRRALARRLLLIHSPRERRSTFFSAALPQFGAQDATGVVGVAQRFDAYVEHAHDENGDLPSQKEYEAALWKSVVSAFDQSPFGCVSGRGWRDGRRKYKCKCGGSLERKPIHSSLFFSSSDFYASRCSFINRHSHNTYYQRSTLPYFNRH